MIEIPHLRDEFTKHFEVAPGEYVAKRASVPIHYRLDGSWVDIDPTWEPQPDGSLILCRAPYLARVPWGTVGVDGYSLPGAHRAHRTQQGTSLWWHGIAPDTSAVLHPSATGLQLHLILWGPQAPRSWLVHHDGSVPCVPGKTRGRDNIERYEVRPGADQHYELEVEYEDHGDGHTLKTWSGRVLSLDPETRRKAWSPDVAYPVRMT